MRWPVGVLVGSALMGSCYPSYRHQHQIAPAPTKEDLRRKDEEARRMEREAQRDWAERQKREEKEQHERNAYLYDKCARATGKTMDECSKYTRRPCSYAIGDSIWVVFIKCGMPTHKRKSNYGQGEQFQFCWSGKRSFCIYDRDGDEKVDAYN